MADQRQVDEVFTYIEYEWPARAVDELFAYLEYASNARSVDQLFAYLEYEVPVGRVAGPAVQMMG